MTYNYCLDLLYFINISTMSALSQQLQKIKDGQRALKVAPQRQQPTILFDPHTASTTSPDLIYTLAVIAYSKLLNAQPSLRVEGEVVMADHNREINRNTLTKQVNRQLSEQLIKFLLKMSPFFLTSDCQKVMEYLLHNYKVNHFEAESLAIIYLQYWNNPVYAKLISNIPEKILASRLSFLKKLESEVINITYIVKHLAYSHYLISTLTLYTLEYMKIDTADAGVMDTEINLGEEITDTESAQSLARCDLRRFLLQVFSEFLTRKLTGCYKYIVQFCGKAVLLKNQSPETVSLVMLLSTRLLIEDSISDELLSGLHLKMLKKLPLLNDKTARSLFDFTLIAWQRRPACIKKEILFYLQDHEKFINYLASFKCSLWMILIRLVELFLEGAQCEKLISCIGLRIKKDEFYLLYADQFLERLFELVQQAYSLENGESLKFLSGFIKQNYLHEIAAYYNQKAFSSKEYKQFVLSLFPKSTYQASQKGSVTFNLALIPKVAPTKPKKAVKEVIEAKIQSEDENAQNHKPKPDRNSLLSKLQKEGIDTKQINFDDERVKSVLVHLVHAYYTERAKSSSKADILSLKQRSAILERYPDEYSQAYLEVDLKDGHFILPIKYLTSHLDLNACKATLTYLSTNIALFDDVLFRELLRLSLEQMSSSLSSQYKPTIYFINTLFKKLISKYLSEAGEHFQLLKLSDLLLKVSEAIFGREGIKRGKYHRILHNHGRVIAELLMRVKSKRNVAKEFNKEEVAILDHYIRTLRIFQTDNLYLLNIGIIETLTRKELDHSQLRYFINIIIHGSLVQSAFSHNDLAVSVIKSVVFCSQLGTLKVPESDINPAFSSGIAKNAITDFFGLVKEKFKRVITKKLLLYIRSIFQNTYIVENFKAELVELPKGDLEQLLSIYTELYRILGMLDSEEKQIASFREVIMDKITNIFPFDLRLALFEPLLPDQHLYKYLGEQLAEHKAERSQFAQLGSLVSIVPTLVSSQWVLFMRECLKRGYLPTEQHLSAVFADKTLGDLSNYAQYICALSEFCPDSLHPHLSTCVQIIESHCQDPNDFTLAIISKVIRSLGELLDPFLDNLLSVAINISSPFIGQFIEDITEHLVTPTLIRVVKLQSKQAVHLKNVSLLFKSVAAKGVGDSLNKTLLQFINRTLSTYVESEEDPEDIIKLQSEVFLGLGLKMNENQLRKFIIDLVRWGETKTDVEESLPFNLRKVAVSQIFCQISENLQALFNPFFGYIFESLLKDYESIVSTALDSNFPKSKGSSDKKRVREDSKEFHQLLVELYIKISLSSLSLLFNNDPDHEFMDSLKVQALGDPLTDLLLLVQVDRYSDVVYSHLLPCLIAFHKSISDDYQMKSINLKIMSLLKHKNSKIHRAIFELTDQLIDSLQDRFLLVVNDLIPFLLESAGSRHEPISKVVRKIISKIEELSGEEIQNYVK